MSDECYTPLHIINAVKRVFGGTIHLDPASSAEADEVVNAVCCYDINLDGLSRDWGFSKATFLNPPYSATAKWVKKALEHRCPTFVLTNNSTETKWGQSLLKHSSAVHFPNKRLNFYGPGLEGKTANRYAQMFTLLWAKPSMVGRFVEEFTDGLTFCGASTPFLCEPGSCGVEATKKRIGLCGSSCDGFGIGEAGA